MACQAIEDAKRAQAPPSKLARLAKKKRACWTALVQASQARQTHTLSVVRRDRTAPR
jgi:hypothetical protein